MRVRGDNDPSTFSIEAMPNKPGWCLVRFYENVEEYHEQLDETTITGWEWLLMTIQNTLPWQPIHKQLLTCSWQMS